MRDARARWQFYEATLQELAEERASTLGRAGQRLKDALAAYREAIEAEGVDAHRIDAALGRARDAAWALVVQRESAGFRSPDFGWLREHWQVPEEVLRRI